MLHLKDFFNETLLDEFLKGKWSGTTYHFSEGKRTTKPATFEMKRCVAANMIQSIMVDTVSGEETFIWLNSVELAVIDREESQLMLQIQSRTGGEYDVLIQSEMETLEDLYFLLDILRDPNAPRQIPFPMSMPVPGYQPTYSPNPLNMGGGFPSNPNYGPAYNPQQHQQGFGQNPNPNTFGQNPNDQDIDW